MVEEGTNKHEENSPVIEEMVQKKDNAGEETRQDSRVESFIKKAVLGNYEITINNQKLPNPVELLEKLYPLRDDESLSDEEKISRLKDIMQEYME